jgi:hypothetical protein
MIPPLYLQWFFQGEWHDIGWTAYTRESRDALRAHGAKLAEHSEPGERYRLVSKFVSHGLNYPNNLFVVHNYPVKEKTV